MRRLLLVLGSFVLFPLATVPSCGPVEKPGSGRNGGVEISVLGQTPQAIQETQPQRDGTVTSVQIAPGNVSILPNQPEYFAGIALNSAGNPVPGVAFTWSATDQNGAPVPMGADGHFQSPTLGTFQITAKGANQQGAVTASVVASIPLDPNVDLDRWTETNRVHAFSAPNEVGRPVRMEIARINGTPVGPELMASPNYGNSNFELRVPIVSQAGRGLPLSFGLTYNSRLWTLGLDAQQNTHAWYDNDRGWPAPGWAFPFVRLERTGGLQTMVIEPDGNNRPEWKLHPADLSQRPADGNP